MFTYKIFDDFIKKEDQFKMIEESKKIEWSFTENVSGIKIKKIKLDRKTNISSLQNGMFYNLYPQNKNNENLMELSRSIIFSLQSILPIDFKVDRIRFGNFFKSDSFGIHNPHVDFYFPHYTLLYYVNDSDGDTFIFNEKVNMYDSSKIKEYPEEFTLLKRVSPKMGRAVLFNGLHYHSSSTPTKTDERTAININLSPQK
jgi:hypothetical protein